MVKNSIMFLIIIMMVVGCKSKVVYVPTIHYEKEILVDTIIDYQIKKEYISIITDDTTSSLINSYSYSTCSLSNGKLIHTLGTKDTVLPIEVVYRNYIKIDSIPYPVEIIKVETRTNPISLYIIIGIIIFLVIRYVR